MDLGRQKIRQEFEDRLCDLCPSVKQRFFGLGTYGKTSLFVDIPEQNFEVLSDLPRSYRVISTVTITGFLWEEQEITGELDSFIEDVLKRLEGLEAVFENSVLKDLECFFSDETERIMGGFSCTYHLRHSIDAQGKADDTADKIGRVLWT